MDTRYLDELEAKIGQVLELVKTLQAERNELQEQVTTWKSRCDEVSRQLDELARERDLLKRNQRDLEQEELIRSKITALLAKLDAA